MTDLFGKRRVLCVCFAVLAFICSFGCGASVENRDEIFDYVKKNLDGLESFSQSVSSTQDYFDSLTTTDIHPINDSEAAEVIDGMYAVGTINNKLFYEEVDYAFVEDEFDKGIIDSISMYTDVNTEYEFICKTNDDFSIGFYYSECNKPLYKGKIYDFESSEAGFRMEFGDNDVFYTEKICDYWFYFKTTY